MNSPPTSAPGDGSSHCSRSRRGGGRGTAAIAGLAAAVLLCGVLTAASAHAQDAASAATAAQFSATLPVDATADSVVKARELARLDGQRRALSEVVEGLGGPSAPARLDKLGDQAITDLVASFSVANERMSAVRYLADYTFHFRPDAVRRLMQGAGISLAAATATTTAQPGGTAGAGTLAPLAAPPSAAPSPIAPAANGGPLVLLPVYVAGAQATLWDDPNPWRDAWNEQPAASGPVSIVVPLGDAGDVMAIDAGRARAGDAPSLAAEARRNGSGSGDETLVALAAPQGPAANPIGLDITVREYRAGSLVATHSESLTANPGESGDALLRRAAAAVAADIENGWQKGQPSAAAEEGRLTAVLPIASLDDWLRARARLAAVPQIHGLSLVALSRQQATIEITYAGSLDQLKAGLAQISLDLVQGAELWRLAARNAPRQTP